MKKITYIAVVLISALCLTSCEGCVKKMAKKATNVGLSAVEGVAEALNEHGDVVAEQAADALGTVAEGAGRSLDRQLNEHAEKVAQVAGRTLVQGVEGIDKGVTAEYYDAIPCVTDLTEGVNLDFFGKIKSKAVIDAYFIILEEATYESRFEFRGQDEKVLMTKETEMVVDGSRKYTLVSFALNEGELATLGNSKDVKVTVTKK